jgi:hypothetical protein
VLLPHRILGLLQKCRAMIISLGSFQQTGREEDMMVGWVLVVELPDVVGMGTAVTGMAKGSRREGQGKVTSPYRRDVADMLLW